MGAHSARHRPLTDLDLTILRAKRQVYAVALLLTAVAALVPLFMVALRHDPFAGLFYVTNIPAVVLCLIGVVLIRWLRAIPHVERIMVGAIIAYILTWDVLNLAVGRVPVRSSVVSGAPVFLLASILLCLVVPADRVRIWLFGLFTLDFVLVWANLLREPFDDLHSTQLTLHIVNAVAVVCLSLIPLYQRLVVSAQADLDTMRDLAHTDPLTGLPNRRSMYQTLDTSESLAVALIDLDDFKKVNDTMGHPAGDRVLVDLARVLRESLPRGAVVGRWGGEEFLVVMPGTSTDTALSWAEHARRTVERASASTNTTLSVGVTSRRAGESHAEMLKRADELMYHAKRTGKNRVCGG